MFVKEKSDSKKKLECVIYNCLFKYWKENIILYEKQFEFFMVSYVYFIFDIKTF